MKFSNKTLNKYIIVIIILFTKSIIINYFVDIYIPALWTQNLQDIYSHYYKNHMIILLLQYSY